MGAADVRREIAEQPVAVGLPALSQDAEDTRGSGRVDDLAAQEPLEIGGHVARGGGVFAALPLRLGVEQLAAQGGVAQPLAGDEAIDRLEAPRRSISMLLAVLSLWSSMISTISSSVWVEPTCVRRMPVPPTTSDCLTVRVSPGCNRPAAICS